MMTGMANHARLTGTLPQVCNGETRTALYRFYDAHENLLYVGISNDPWRRWREHVYDKAWYPQVKHQAVTWYDTEPEAARAELGAIRAEGPRFNVAGALRPPDARFQVRVTVIANLAGLLGIVGLILTCTAIAEPAVPLFAAATAVMLASLLTGWAAVMILCAPWIARFAHWLERNWDAPDPKGK